MGPRASWDFYGVEAMKNTTLCTLVDRRGKRVLLGMKKQGFGSGKWNGFGGKVKDGETLEQAAARELYEELGVRAESIRKVCELTFEFPHVPKVRRWDQLVHVFLVEKWDGEPKEGREMRPQWFPFGEIPYGEMWQDDSHWLPLVLQGKKVRGRFVFAEDGNSIKDMELGEVKEF
jgi:8-oxo-dGTP pyrophosphatase MutT (NUDIX family)